jgi:MSHA pilin protein MshA
VNKFGFNMSLMRQQGFTLIELVMVIVILGILAATALPKFANMQSEARIAAMKGAYAALNSALTIAHAEALINNKTTNATGDTITMEGNAVALAYGYPDSTAAGIVKAVTLTGDIAIAGGATSAASATVNFTTTITNCNVTYATSTALNTPPVVTLTQSGC